MLLARHGWQSAPASSFCPPAHRWTIYLLCMSRLWIYLAAVLAAGLGAGSWFVATEEVDPAATEPGAYDFLLVVTAAAAMASALVLCLVAEIVVRLVQRRNRTTA
ncbi:hypothetical protein GCM10023339_47430 [Alloalcanivorax gelatiniphagus]